MHLPMYRYRDGNGNTFLLSDDEDACLVLEPATVSQQVPIFGSNEQTASQPVQRYLGQAERMQLIAAFHAAIDNKVLHRELCVKHSGMITTLQDGQQRRYILCPDSTIQRDLEAELWAVWGAGVGS